MTRKSARSEVNDEIGERRRGARGPPPRRPPARLDHTPSVEAFHRRRPTTMSCRLTLALALAAAGASAFDCSQRSECCGRTNNKKKETYYLGTLNEIWGSQDKCESKTYCAGKVDRAACDPHAQDFSAAGPKPKITVSAPGRAEIEVRGPCPLPRLPVSARRISNRRPRVANSPSLAASRR